jgi:protein-tyrosine phosphatase
MKVLFVCTGNICRSPLGKQMLDQLLVGNAWTGSIQTTSAGTHAMVDYPMNPGSVTAFAALGYSPQLHKAVQLTPQLVADSDLVLTFTEQQRAHVVEHHVRANRYTFTLLEFAHLATYQAGTRAAGHDSNLDELLAATVVSRGMASLLPTYDIADPYGKDLAAFERMAVQTKDALQQVIKWLP